MRSEFEMIEQLTDKMGGLHFIHIYIYIFFQKWPLLLKTATLILYFCANHSKTTTLTFSHHFLVHLHKALAAGTPEKTGDDMTMVPSFQTVTSKP